MKSFIFAKSAQGIPIPAYRWNNSGAHVLIIGGVHGDEVEGVVAANGILGEFLKSYTYKLKITLIPALNMDGVLNKTRQNGNGVDLNRNLPTQDWSPHIANPRYHPGTKPNSEPENQALVRFLETEKPRMVYSLHSWFPLININGKCRREAEMLQSHTGYKITDDMGYPTPGALGTYCGLERDIPTITYEIERGLKADKILSIHVPALLEALKVTEKLA